jgi:hypothetical protein
MLDEKEGWAAGLNGMLLHYSKQPGSTDPTWQYVKPLNTGTFNARQQRV